MKRLYMSGCTANVIVHLGMPDERVQFIPEPFSIKDPAANVREVLREKWVNPHTRKRKHSIRKHHPEIVRNSYRWSKPKMPVMIR